MLSGMFSALSADPRRSGLRRARSGVFRMVSAWFGVFSVVRAGVPSCPGRCRAVPGPVRGHGTRGGGDVSGGSSSSLIEKER